MAKEELVPQNGANTPMTSNKEGIQPLTLGEGINYGNVANVDMGDMQAISKVFENAKPAPFNASMNSWTPQEAGESKLLMFTGALMMDVEWEGKKDRVPYVEFAEQITNKKTGEMLVQKVMTGRAQIVNFFLSTEKNGEQKTVNGSKQYKGSMWLITYQGIKALKGKNMHTYIISPAVIS